MRRLILLLLVVIPTLKATANPCEAYFTFSADSFTIFLNGSGSAGDVVSWHWYINNDLFSDAGPETHITVSEPGEYQICLVIETASGCIDTFCHGVLVELSGDCEANFTWNVEDSTIFLNGATSTGEVISWHWYINNDLFSDEGPETHITVGEPGEYQICLVIETASGCIDTFCHGVLVELSGDCEANFTWNVEDSTILLNGATSTGEVISWHWYINNDLFSDAGPETHITVGEPGEYQICLVIETTSGCIDTFCHGVLVELSGDCEANFTWNVEDSTIFLNGATSTGEVISWHWYINNDLFSDTGPETHITVGEPGEYQICLVIETASGCIDTFCHEAPVEDSPGDCHADFTAETDGLTIFLNGSSSMGDISSWHWFVNDSLFSETGPETHVTMDHPGDYEICLIIKTITGCIDTFCDHVTIEGIIGGGDYNFKMLPPNTDGSLNILIFSPSGGSFTIYLTDMTGKKIFEQSAALIAGTEQYVIPATASLPIGIYLVTMQFNSDATKTGKTAILK